MPVFCSVFPILFYLGSILVHQINISGVSEVTKSMILIGVFAKIQPKLNKNVKNVWISMHPDTTSLISYT